MYLYMTTNWAWLLLNHGLEGSERFKGLILIYQLRVQTSKRVKHETFLEFSSLLIDLVDLLIRILLFSSNFFFFITFN